MNKGCLSFLSAEFLQIVCVERVLGVSSFVGVLQNPAQLWLLLLSTVYLTSHYLTSRVNVAVKFRAPLPRKII